MFLVNVGSHTCYSYFAAIVFMAVGLCDWSQGTLVKFCADFLACFQFHFVHSWNVLSNAHYSITGM